MGNESVLEVGARLTETSIGGAGCRVIAGDSTLTIGPDLACMCIGNTERSHATVGWCVPSRPPERGLWVVIGM